MNINLEQELVHYPFSKEVLYQLLFSIIRDVILISRDQSEKQQIITVDFHKAGMNFEFQAFPLSVQKLGQLSRILNENQPDMFLLDFDRILLSLEKHNLEYGNLDDHDYIEQFVIDSGMLIGAPFGVIYHHYYGFETNLKPT